MKVQVLIRDYPDKYGLYHYTRAICDNLKKTGAAFELVRPSLPVLLKTVHRFTVGHGFDIRRFFTTFPLAAQIDRSCLKHLTTQQMGSLLLFQRGIRPAVVSVHDIVPWLARGDPEQDTFRHGVESIFDRLAMTGLRRGDCLIASSAYTKQTLVEHLKISAEKVRVVHLGVDHRVFKPGPIGPAFRKKFGLEEDRRYILFVGAETPRKNLARLLLAVAKVKTHVPKLGLIMVGGGGITQQRPQLLSIVERLGLKEMVRFVGYVVEQDIVQFYNLAEVFAFPSLYEGFGLPTLEAMACGTAVVCSRAAALPEVVGGAAVLVDPYDVTGLAHGIEQVLEDKAWRDELRCRGLERASKFSWERTARDTIQVYKQAGEFG